MKLGIVLGGLDDDGREFFRLGQPALGVDRELKLLQALGGGLADLSIPGWIRCRQKFFLPVRVLSRLFRGKLLTEVEAAWKRGELTCDDLEIGTQKEFNRFKDKLRSTTSCD